MDMNEATAKAIGAERGIADMTVRQLASASGIPERSLMRVLQAERDIKVNQVAQIASALGIYPHELIETAEQLLAREVRGRATLIVAPADTPGGEQTAARRSGNVADPSRRDHAPSRSHGRGAGGTTSGRTDEGTARE